MISKLATDLAHRQIILDLTIRTLERDRMHIGEFKMQKAFETWFDLKVLELHMDLKAVKAELGRISAKIQAARPDGDFTIYTVVEQRRTFDLRYLNISLKNWTENEVRRLLGLEHKTVLMENK